MIDPALLQQAFVDELRELQAHDLLRTITTIDALRGVELRLGDRWLTAWCTNDYLGFSLHPRLIQAAHCAMLEWGVGARASRLLAGSTRLHAQLEARLASYFGAEDAVVFASGYLANLGTIPAFVGPEDAVVIDRLAHASLIDACRASRASLRVFRHNDPTHLRTVLRRLAKARRRLIVSEGVFSMDGDTAPLPELLRVAHEHEALVYLDDAHGVFATGPQGRGTPEVCGVPHGAMGYMGTLGKALGCQGGFVIGSRAFLDVVRNRARTFLYSTALAVPVVAAALEAVALLEDDSEPRARLARNVQELHRQLRAAAWCLPAHGQAPSHIVPLVVGGSHQAMRLSAGLLSRGIFVPAIRPPTVPDGTARLRISLSALHTPQQIQTLVQALAEARHATD